MLRITRCRNGSINDAALEFVLFALFFVVFGVFCAESDRCSVVSQGGYTIESSE